MNRNTHTIDDPKLTAYALGELSAKERADIERLLAEDPKAREQLEETIAFAVQLGSALRAEEAPELRADQLRAIREAARKRRTVIAFPAWLTRAAVPVAAAAGVALAGWFAVPAFRGVQQTPTRGEIADIEAQSKPSEAWLERAAELADKDLGQQVAMVPATPQPTARPNETPIVKNRELTPALTRKSQMQVQVGEELTARERQAGLQALKAPSPTTAAPASGDGGVNRGALTLGLAPQSAAGGSLGQVPAATPAQAGGAIAKTDAMAYGGAKLATAEARPAAGGAVGAPSVSAAGAGGALAVADGSLAGVGDTKGREKMVELKLELPKPQFQGTPTPIKLPNLEPIEGERRPVTVADGASARAYGAPAPTTGVASDHYHVAIMPHPAPPAPEPPIVVGKPLRPFDTETYDKIEDNAFLDVTQNPLSTFSIDVDTGSYANVRRFLRGGQLPPAGAVRIEEMLNYFEYDYPPAPEGKPFSVSVDVVEAPWNAKHQLARIGLKGREIDPANRPPCNLVFLLDVSGSMNQPNKLPLVKQAMRILLEQLGAKDRVAIVTYAGASGLALPSTPADRQRDIREAIDELRPGGSTNGEAGIQLAYDIAKANLIPGGANRVILATDGDFNIGVTSRDELLRVIEEKAKSDVFLTVLGFGMGNIKDATLEQLADKGNGTYGYIDDEREAKRLFARHATGSLVTIAKDVKIQVEFNPARVGAYRLIGYENRALRAEDFNDDKKDAGEIGSGHTVTALYELVPPGEATDLPKVDELKYQQPAKAAPAAKSDEIMTVKLRYKKPDGDTSDKIEVPVTGEARAIASASTDLKFAAAVAEFGMLLRGSPNRGSADWKSALELAAAGRGADAHGDRAEFIDLIRAAEKLSDQR